VYMTLCSDVVGYQDFGGWSYFHVQGEVKGSGKGSIDIGTSIIGSRVGIGQ